LEKNFEDGVQQSDAAHDLRFLTIVFSGLALIAILARTLVSAIGREDVGLL
jgi:hypothetical protein